jgi:dethiobiotin synthetase
MKPVSAGCDADGQNDDVKQLCAASNVSASHQQINPYSFVPAVAPHLAAQQAGINIDLARIVESYKALAAQADVVIVEGAGGFLVPLNDTQDGGDLARALGLPVILVVGIRLGCLNHALLTVEAIAARGLMLAGWVANVVDRNMVMLDENIATLSQRITAPLLGVVPYTNEPDARVAARQLELERLI